MKMVTRTAFANMKYHKSKNILTGIAIFLTTVLLFIVPSVGMNIIDAQFAMVNKVYPTWHALYRSVDMETVAGLAAHSNVGIYGLRSDMGMIPSENAEISMCYMDETGLELYRIKLQEGTFPSEENEIVVSEGMLKDLEITADIGDTVILPFQRYTKDGMDYAREKEFRICGFLPDGDTALKKHTYTALISEQFLKEEIPEEEITYRFLFRVAGDDRASVDEVEKKIKDTAEDFGISQTDIGINDDYLIANYTDPSAVPIIVMIMLVVMLAGIITIYSIYYVSMTQRVQEFGRMKAIGATRRQIRQIVLREGLCVAAVAVPLGLIASTILIRPILLFFTARADDNSMVQIYREIILNHEIFLYKWWIYLLAAAVTLVTVYLSLLIPMRKASAISEVEAMRFQGNQVKGKVRKGYRELTIGRLTRTSIAGNKKKSLITILSMSITGVFVMVVATALSCINPVESANNDIYGQYEISLNAESGNMEHPEREWKNLIRNNPLSEELKEQIEGLEGVRKVEAFTFLLGETNLEYGGEKATETIAGLPESCFQELKAGIVEGDAVWEDLLEGDKIIVKKEMLYWYPDIKVGDMIRFQCSDGVRTETRNLEVIAIGDYRFGLGEYNYMIMSKEAADQFLDEDCTGYFQVIAEENYDEDLEAKIRQLTDSSELLVVGTWKEHFDEWKQSMSLTRGACYAFLSILSIICVMNLINTMINSIHVRKKELGMMQAIGMTEAQLKKMLRLEGMFYTVGTLLVSIGLGSALGYPAFLWMKSGHWFSVQNYHYPAAAAIIVAVVLVAVQLFLTAVLSHSVQKESLIDRIRFSE
ncbi:MAG: FtsX-like permease family protein [Eubacteriales bacterium]|nr:FtsX-like permease family protein [Eubacteriales bacterium]